MALQHTGGPAVAAQFVNSDRPTYAVPFSCAPVAAMDLVSIAPPAPASKPTVRVVRLRRLVIANPGSATAAAVATVQVGTCTAQGSGGAVATPRVVDPVNDPAAASTAHTGASTPGAGFAALGPALTVAVPVAAAAAAPIELRFGEDGFRKSPTVSKSAGVVLAVRCSAVGAGATGFSGWVEFTEEPI